MAGGRAKWIVAGAVALVALSAAALGVTVAKANRDAVKRLAAPHLSCDAANIVVVASELTDASERYEVRGCGREGTLRCLGPDFQCSFEPR